MSSNNGVDPVHGESFTVNDRNNDTTQTHDATIPHKTIKNSTSYEEDNFETQTGKNSESERHLVELDSNKPNQLVSNEIDFGPTESIFESSNRSSEKDDGLLLNKNVSHHPETSLEENESFEDNLGNREFIASDKSLFGGNDTLKNFQKSDIVDHEDIDAPVPSPFSDIGDISGAENAMITDILKESSHPHHIPSALEGFAQNLETIDDSNNDSNDNIAGDNIESNSISNQEMISEQEDKHNRNVESQEQGGGDVGGLIADIFGDSDDEEEEFEGFNEDELQTERQKFIPHSVALDNEELDDTSDKNDRAGERVPGREEIHIEDKAEAVQATEKDAESSSDEELHEKPEVISDFDLMMQRKKEAMGSRRRKKRDFDIINDNDDIIAAMIRSMRDAAEEDRMLNQAGRAATKKLSMLESVVSHLHKADLQHTFIDGGVLPVMKEWLSPLPDNSLPHIMIRKQFLRLLSEFPALDTGALKMSGIGRAVMLLYKHPKESRENRSIAGKIVANWARPIFGVQSNFKDISKEEREERDKSNAAEYKKRRLSSTDGSIRSGAEDEKNRPRRPGDKGFIARARVPRPSNRDYIVRPRSDVSFAELGSIKSPKKSLDRFEIQMRKYKERKGMKNTATRAVSMSLNGSKMTL